MANKTIFRSFFGKLLPKTDTHNKAAAPAYAFSPKHALAQYASTGCMNHTFYASAEEQLEKVLKLLKEIEPHFIAQTAIYCRKSGYMKDMPALLCAYLSTVDATLLRAIFPKVIDNGKMLRNFVQIMRSGVVGRKSLGTLPKKLVIEWLNRRDDDTIFKSSIGNDPSFADIIKMVHPLPTTPNRKALYAYLIGREYEADLLTPLIRQFEDFKAKRTNQVPDIPFQMLTSLNLGKAEWSAIARNASWQMTRMNLNTFSRHGVFENEEMVQLIASRISNPDEIKRAKVFPYQLMVAYKNSKDVPLQIQNALQDAMETAIANVPQISGQIYVLPDVSGSMGSSVTGFRKGSISAVRCIDVAALVTAAILRRNPSARIIPFEQTVVEISLNPRDSVMTNAEKLASIGGGGTNCSAPLKLLNDNRAKGDLVIYISDNQSWIDTKPTVTPNISPTSTMTEWAHFKSRNPKAKLVCIDIQPYATTQAQEREDILNIGGFSDDIFSLLSMFAEGKMKNNHWVEEIERIQI